MRLDETPGERRARDERARDTRGRARRASCARNVDAARRRARCRARSASPATSARQRITMSESGCGTRGLTSIGGDRRLVHLLVAHRERVGAVERRKADERLVQQNADRVDVAAAVDELAHRLLGRHVVRRAHRAAARREPPMKARRRDAEVGDQRVAVLVEQHVVRLHVAMHDAAAMRVVERARRPAPRRSPRAPDRRSAFF